MADGALSGATILVVTGGAELDRVRTVLEAEGATLLTARDELHSLREAELAGLARVGLAAEHRDDNTREHTLRVARIAAALAGALGAGEETVRLIELAAPLHDVGKIAIPDSILMKPGKLTAEEFEVVKTHTTIGARILAGGTGEITRMAEQIARGHHERFDGTGYPDGIAGEAIPLSCRAVAVADAYDILTHERHWRDASSPPEALAELRRNAGTQFDPAAVEAFEALPEDLRRG